MKYSLILQKIFDYPKLNYIETEPYLNYFVNLYYNNNKKNQIKLNQIH